MDEPAARAIAERVTAAIQHLGARVEFITISAHDEGMSWTALVNQVPVTLFVPANTETAYDEVARAMLNGLTMPIDPNLWLKLPKSAGYRGN